MNHKLGKHLLKIGNKEISKFTQAHGNMVLAAASFQRRKSANDHAVQQKDCNRSVSQSLPRFPKAMAYTFKAVNEPSGSQLFAFWGNLSLTSSRYVRLFCHCVQCCTSQQEPHTKLWGKIPNHTFLSFPEGDPCFWLDDAISGGALTISCQETISGKGSSISREEEYRIARNTKFLCYRKRRYLISNSYIAIS